MSNLITAKEVKTLSDDNMIGEFIKNHRTLSGFKSQRELSRATNVSPATISRIEKGIQKPEVRTLRDLSKSLSTTSFKELMIISGYIASEDS